MDEALDTFSIRLPVAIRACREEDLPALAALAPGEPLHALFAQHRGGDMLMLVAEVNGQACGQLWVDLDRRRAERAAEIWSVRVLPGLRGQGIGARLVRAAEGLLRERGLHWALLGVEADNPRARRLYERLGYSLAQTTVPVHGSAPQWVLRKDLRRAKAVNPA